MNLSKQFDLEATPDPSTYEWAGDVERKALEGRPSLISQYVEQGYVIGAPSKPNTGPADLGSLQAGDPRHKDYHSQNRWNHVGLYKPKL